MTKAEELKKIHEIALKSAENLTDGELAGVIRFNVERLNALTEVAAKRELITTYRIKPQDQSAPKLIVSVMTEVA